MLFIVVLALSVLVTLIAVGKLGVGNLPVVVGIFMVSLYSLTWVLTKIFPPEPSTLTWQSILYHAADAFF